MKLKKKGNYVDPNWVLEDVMCTGKGWDQNGKKTCYSIWDLDSEDIVKREYTDVFKSTSFAYGFICSECHCFTEIDENLIPEQVKHNCIQVAAKGSDKYKRLSHAEKKRSEYL